MSPSLKRYYIFLIFNVTITTKNGPKSETFLKTLIYSYSQSGRVFWKDLESDDSYEQKSSIEIMKSLVYETCRSMLGVCGHVGVSKLTWKNNISQSSFSIKSDSD